MTKTKKVEDYSRFFTKTSASRIDSPIHVLIPLMAQPGMLSLGGGLPNTSTFPIIDLSITLTDGTVVKTNQDRLKLALQYSPTEGLPDLTKWLYAFQEKIHNPPLGMKNLEILPGNGTQDLIGKIFDMMVERGDSVLIENPSYAGALAALKPLGPNLLAVDTDQFGLVPSKLRQILENHKGAPPKFLYTVPNGSNPTGASLTLERKKEIYQLAQEYDFIIVEDDAYYYLQFQERTPTFLSMDVDGRVIRLDSFSKIVAPGLRLGFATGPPPLIQRLNMHMQATALHPSGLSQAILLGILESMGMSGLLEHTKKISEFYRDRMHIFLKLVEKHLTGLAEWNPPAAGMFFWIKLLGVTDSYRLIREKAMEQKVILIPGAAFLPHEGTSPYVRAAFSTASPEQMDEALRRFALLLKEK
jgi:kynurenine/2-aminoadipate aminotransferase